MEGLFERLAAVNVNEHKKDIPDGKGKKPLSYLSWTWAWDQFKRACPDATYRIWRDEQGRPYVYDPQTGYMVFTEITAGGETYSMWLAVMDSHNAAMKTERYKVETKYSSYYVEAATMTDINKSIMRCLTKNMAMFGLGLYIYAGEDLPSESPDDMPTESGSLPAEGAKNEKPKNRPTNGKKATEGAESETKKAAPEEVKPDTDSRLEEAKLRAQVLKYVTAHKLTQEKVDKICECYKVEKLNDLNAEQCRHYLALAKAAQEGKKNE